MSVVGVRLDYDLGRDVPAGRKGRGVQRQGALISRHALFQHALTACDIVTLVIAFAASYWLVATLLMKGLLAPTTYVWLLWVIIPAWMLSLRWFGLYETPTYVSLLYTLGQLVRAHFVAALLLLSTMYATKAVIVSRVLMQTFLMVSFVALTCQKSALQALLKRHRWRVAFNRPRVLLVGNPEKTSRYLSLLKRHASMTAQVVGLLAPCAAEASARHPTRRHPFWASRLTWPRCSTVTWSTRSSPCCRWKSVSWRGWRRHARPVGW